MIDISTCSSVSRNTGCFAPREVKSYERSLVASAEKRAVSVLRPMLLSLLFPLTVDARGSGDSHVDGLTSTSPMHACYRF